MNWQEIITIIIVAAAVAFIIVRIRKKTCDGGCSCVSKEHDGNDKRRGNCDSCGQFDCPLRKSK